MYTVLVLIVFIIRYSCIRTDLRQCITLTYSHSFVGSCSCVHFIPYFFTFGFIFRFIQFSLSICWSIFSSCLVVFRFRTFSSPLNRIECGIFKILWHMYIAWTGSENQRATAFLLRHETPTEMLLLFASKSQTSSGESNLFVKYIQLCSRATVGGNFEKI